MEMARVGEGRGWDVAAFLRRSMWTLRVEHAFQTLRASFADRGILSQHTAAIPLTKTKHTAPSRKTHLWILAPADLRPQGIPWSRTLCTTTPTLTTNLYTCPWVLVLGQALRPCLEPPQTGSIPSLQ